MFSLQLVGLEADTMRFAAGIKARMKRTDLSRHTFKQSGGSLELSGLATAEFPFDSPVAWQRALYLGG